MLTLISDPTLYLLLAAAYVIGFVDPEEPTGRSDRWGSVSDLAFWIAIALAAVLFAVHGAAGGLAGVAGGWALAVVGVRRGILAQRNILWESSLWTMPLELIMASARQAVPVDEPVAEPAPSRRRASQVRTIEWQLPTLADILPGRGRCLTMLGVAMDMAACVAFMSVLSLLAR